MLGQPGQRKGPRQAARPGGQIAAAEHGDRKQAAEHERGQAASMQAGSRRSGGVAELLQVANRSFDFACSYGFHAHDRIRHGAVQAHRVQRGDDLAGRLEALRRVGRKEPAHDLLEDAERGWQRLPLQARGGVAHRVTAAERHSASERGVEHHAETEEIRAAVERGAAHLLRAGIARRSETRPIALPCPAGKRRGDAEVRQVRRALDIEEDVLRLHVAVNHALAVRVVQGEGDLLHHHQHVLHVQAGAQVRVQIAATQVFHRQIRGFAVETGVEDAHDIRMVETLDERSFALEAPSRLRGRRGAGRQELDGDEARMRLLHGEVHPRRRAGADQALDSVARNLRQRQTNRRQRRCAVIHRGHGGRDLARQTSSVRRRHPRRRWCKAERPHFAAHQIAENELSVQHIR